MTVSHRDSARLSAVYAASNPWFSAARKRPKQRPFQAVFAATAFADC